MWGLPVMLVALSIENYRSIKERVDISFVSTKNSEVHDRPTKINKDFSINKVACLIGPNGSGKTHVLDALDSFCDVARGSDVEEICLPHLLDSEWINKPTVIEVLLYNHDEKRFSRYKLAAFKGRVVEEELATRSLSPRSREKKVFTRLEKEISFNREFKSLETLAKDISNKTSLIRFSEAFNNEELKFVRSELSFLFKYETDRSTVSAFKFVEKLITDEEKVSKNNRTQYLKDVTKIIQSFDVPVSKISIKRKEGKDKLIFNHVNYEVDMDMLDIIDFYSRGSFNLIGFVLFYSLINNLGGILLFDEFDSTLHFKVAKKAIQMIAEVSKNNTQVIFATQNIYLLDEILRRDEIYLLSKENGFSTTVQRISDFSVRKDAKISTKYFNDEFGGLPNFKKDLS